MASSSTAATDARTRERRRRRKLRLQDALLTLLGSSSFRELRVEDIAEAAGLSRSAFYFYYPDKNALLMDATGELAEALFAQADRWWSGTGEPEQLIREVVAGIARIWTEHARLSRRVAEVATYDERINVFWWRLVDRFAEATREQIEAEQRAGRVDPGLDARGVARFLTLGIERTLYVHSRDGQGSLDEVVAGIADVWLRTLYGCPSGERGAGSG